MTERSEPSDWDSLMQARAGDGRPTSTRLDPMRPLSHGPRLLVLGIVGGIVVLALGLAVTHISGWSGHEMRILEWLSDHHVAALNGFALAIAWTFSPAQAIGITVLGTVVVLLVTRSPWRAGTFLLLVILSWGSSKVVKIIVHRPRPDSALLAHPLAIEHSSSFPSGHVCFAAALGLAILIMMRDSRRRAKVTATIIVSAAVVVVALSRIYVGVHYPTDVIGAIVYIPSATAVLLWLWYDVTVPRLPRTRPGRRIAVRR